MWGGVFEARLRLFFPTCSPGTIAEPPLREPVLQTGPLPLFEFEGHAALARFCALAQRRGRVVRKNRVLCGATRAIHEASRPRDTAPVLPPQKIRSNEQQRDFQTKCTVTIKHASNQS